MPFLAGIASGRVVLAFALAKRMGERSFAVLMLVLASGLLGITMAVRSFIVDAVAIAFAGFFLGYVHDYPVESSSKLILFRLQSCHPSGPVGRRRPSTSIAQVEHHLTYRRLGSHRFFSRSFIVWSCSWKGGSGDIARRVGAYLAGICLSQSRRR